MPFDGSGTFNRVMRWQNDAAAGIKIKADRHDQEDDGFATGLSTCLTRDGQSSPTNDISWNGKKLTNLADPTLNQDAATKKYVDGKTSYSTPLELSGSGANGRLKFTGTTPPLGLEFEAQDLFFGVKAGNQWVWNDKADATGIDVMALTEAANLTLKRTDAGASAGPLIRLERDSSAPAAGNFLSLISWRGKNSADAMGDYADIYGQIDSPTANSEDGRLTLRRMVGGVMTIGLVLNKDGVTVSQKLAVTGAVTLASTLTVTGATTLNAAMTIAGSITAAGNFISSTTVAALAATGAGTILLRPNGINNATGQTSINTAGAMAVGGDLTANGKITAGGEVTAVSRFLSSTSQVVLAPAPGAGTILLRPNGPDSTTGQALLNSTGALSLAAGLTAGSSVTAGNNVTAGSGNFIGGTNVFVGPAATGEIRLRPNGIGSTTGQTVIEPSNGNMSVAGRITSEASFFIGGGLQLYIGPTGAGDIRLRPNGVANPSGQTLISANGDMSVAGSLTAGGALAAGSISTTGSASFNNITAGGTLTANGVVSEGSVTAGNNVTAGSGNFIGGTNVFLGPAGAGEIRLRPNGVASTTGQTVIAANGDMTVAGALSAGALSGTSLTVTGAANFNSGTFTGNISVAGVTASASLTAGNNVTAGSGNFIGGTNAILSSAAAGEIRLRPNGLGSTTGQVVLAASGLLTAVSANAGNISAGVTPFGSAAGAGVVNFGHGTIYSKKDGTANQTHVSFYNNAAATPALVGSISTNGAATAYNTSSDETLKEFIGPYDPLMAIEIIRADPVRDFHWKVDGEYAVGWGAQTSYEVSHDLASPPPTAITGEEGEPAPFWGMDQSKRTPYLWAALTWALDRIDELLARVETLEGGAA